MLVSLVAVGELRCASRRSLVIYRADEVEVSCPTCPKTSYLISAGDFDPRGQPSDPGRDG